MANEIVGYLISSGNDAYFQVRKSDRTILASGTTFQAYNSANWTTYAKGQAAADTSGYVSLSFAALSLPAGFYFVDVFECANGGTPASTDNFARHDEFYWDGTQRIDRLSGVVVGSLLAGALTTAAIADGALTAAKFGTGSVKKNTAFANFPFVMIGTDGNVAVGKTITAQRSIESGAFASCANAASEVANGAYKIDLAAADLNGNSVTLRFTATGCRPTLLTLFPQP